ncbi:MAG TPA: HpsJ family protein [Coleofasciculaceae cyanobacterium]
MVPLASPPPINPFIAKNLCRIVGCTCLAGFLIDLLAIGLPPNPLAIEWRMNFLQQLGDRSIILLFGSALVFYSNLGNQRLLKQFALGCLIVGVLFQIFCVLIIHDSTVLQQQAVDKITTQGDQLRTQLEQNLKNPNITKQLTPEQLQQAPQMITNRVEALKQNAQTSITKLGISSVGNLVIVGLGLISLGRYGMRLRGKAE